MNANIDSLLGQQKEVLGIAAKLCCADVIGKVDKIPG
jgi:hypothetical protein